MSVVGECGILDEVRVGGRCVSHPETEIALLRKVGGQQPVLQSDQEESQALPCRAFHGQGLWGGPLLEYIEVLRSGSDQRTGVNPSSRLSMPGIALPVGSMV